MVFVREAAKYLGVSKDYVRRLVKEKAPPDYKRGRAWRIKRKEVERLKRMRKRYLTPRALADQLGVNTQIIYAHIRKGKLEAVKLRDGKKPRLHIEPRSLKRFLWEGVSAV